MIFQHSGKVAFVRHNMNGGMQWSTPNIDGMWVITRNQESLYSAIEWIKVYGDKEKADKAFKREIDAWFYCENSSELFKVYRNERDTDNRIARVPKELNFAEEWYINLPISSVFIAINESKSFEECHDLIRVMGDTPENLYLTFDRK